MDLYLHIISIITNYTNQPNPNTCQLVIELIEEGRKKEERKKERRKKGRKKETYSSSSEN
jgi:hypothetical protein